MNQVERAKTALLEREESCLFADGAWVGEQTPVFLDD